MAGRLARDHDREDEDGSQHLLLRALASAPLRLTVGVAVLVGVALVLVSGIRATTVLVPEQAVDTSGRPALPQSGERLVAVLESDALTPEYISAIQRITERAEKTQGVVRVRSVTNSLVLVKAGPFKAGATAPLGPASRLPLEVTLSERAQRAAAGRLGSGELISTDGRTTAVIAELQAGIGDDQRRHTADQFEAVVQSEAQAAGIGITSRLAGDTYTVLAATDGLRSDFSTIVLLACILPAGIALVALRRRVPVGALLAASGAALLLSSVLVVNTIGVDAGTLPGDHPVAQGNRIMDERLHGMIPLEVEFTGAPGDFRRPDVLARLDALTNWLRDEYGVNATGLSSTMRDETGVITGVDSVPPNPDDLNSLLEDTAAFDNGTFLHSIVTEDYSRTRLIGSWPDRGPGVATSVAARFDTIASATLADTGIVARFRAKMPTAESASTTLANDLGIMGGLALVLAAVLALLGLWAQHALADRAWGDPWMGGFDEDEIDLRDESSLFERDHEDDGGIDARGLSTGGPG